MTDLGCDCSTIVSLSREDRRGEQSRGSYEIISKLPWLQRTMPCIIIHKPLFVCIWIIHRWCVYTNTSACTSGDRLKQSMFALVASNRNMSLNRKDGDNYKFLYQRDGIKNERRVMNFRYILVRALTLRFMFRIRVPWAVRSVGRLTSVKIKSSVQIISKNLPVHSYLFNHCRCKKKFVVLLVVREVLVHKKKTGIQCSSTNKTF